MSHINRDLVGIVCAFRVVNIPYVIMYFLLRVHLYQLLENLDAKSSGTEGSSGGGFSLYNTPGGIPWLEGKFSVYSMYSNFLVHLGSL